MSTIYARRLLATLLSIRGGANVGTGGSSPLPYVVHWSPHKSLPNKFWHSEEEKEGEERNKGKREERKKNESPWSKLWIRPLPIVATTYTNHFGTSGQPFPCISLSIHGR